MRSSGLGALACGLALSASTASAAADYTRLEFETTAHRPADQAWARIGDYCAIKEWFGSAQCVLVGGSGDLGTVRQLGGVDELVVGRTPLSYTYAMVAGPFVAANYHGNLEVRPIDARTSKILVRLMWDQAAMDPAQRERTRTQLQGRFQAAMTALKAMAEK